MNSLLSLVSEADGNLSSTRVVMFLVVAAILVPAVHYAWVAGKPGIELTNEQIMLISACLAAKVVQHKSEPEAPKPTPPTP